ncbi:MAG: winged helix-turn-helix transcriptional regulator [Dehalococcoidia bacterium]
MPKREWTFVTNHGAVLTLIARRGQITAKEIADTLGLTERPVRRIIAELEQAGYLRKSHVGRINQYWVNEDQPLRAEALRDTAVGVLIQALRVRLPKQKGGGQYHRAEPG